MPIRSGLIVMLKLVALLALFQILGYMVAVAAIADRPLPSIVFPIALAAFLLIPFLLVFWCAGPIVDFLAPKQSELVPEAPFTLSGLQAVAFSTLGAFILYLALTRTIGLIAVWQMSRDAYVDMPVSPTDILQTIASWVVGFYLLLGAPALRQWLSNLRQAGGRVD